MIYDQMKKHENSKHYGYDVNELLSWVHSLYKISYTSVGILYEVGFSYFADGHQNVKLGKWPGACDCSQIVIMLNTEYNKQLYINKVPVRE